MSLLVKLSAATLCIPHSNAKSEQIFSRLSLAKSKFRSQMTRNTLNGVLTVNFNVKENCYLFIQSARMIVKARHYMNISNVIQILSVTNKPTRRGPQCDIVAWE